MIKRGAVVLTAVCLALFATTFYKPGGEIGLADLSAVGNMRNGGTMCAGNHGEYFYLSDSCELVKAGGDEQDPLLEPVSQCYCTYGEWLYYTDGSALKRVQTASGAVEVLGDYVCRELIAYQDQLYFTAMVEEMPGIYSMNVDGTEVTQVYPDFARYLCGSNGNLFFQGGKEGRKDLYGIELESGALKRYDIGQDVNDFFVVYPKVYFVGGSYRLYAADLIEGTCQLVHSGPIDILTTNICEDGWLVSLCDENLRPCVYLYHFRTGKLELLSHSFVNHIYVIHGKAYAPAGMGEYQKIYG